MDIVTRPLRTAKRLSGSHPPLPIEVSETEAETTPDGGPAESSESGDDSDDGLDGDDEGEETSGDEAVNERPTQRAPDPKAVRRSSRASASNMVL